MAKKPPRYQQVLVPKGTIDPNEDTVIQIPQNLMGKTMVVARRRDGLDTTKSSRSIQFESEPTSFNHSFHSNGAYAVEEPRITYHQRPAAAIAPIPDPYTHFIPCYSSSRTNTSVSQTLPIEELEKTEESEKILIQKKLENFQKARRQFLLDTTAITTKSTQTAPQQFELSLPPGPSSYTRSSGATLMEKPTRDTREELRQSRSSYSDRLAPPKPKSVLAKDSDSSGSLRVDKKLGKEIKPKDDEEKSTCSKDEQASQHRKSTDNFYNLPKGSFQVGSAISINSAGTESVKSEGVKTQDIPYQHNKINEEQIIESLIRRIVDYCDTDTKIPRGLLNQKQETISKKNAETECPNKKVRYCTEFRDIGTTTSHKYFEELYKNKQIHQTSIAESSSKCIPQECASEPFSITNEFIDLVHKMDEKRPVEGYQFRPENLNNPFCTTENIYSPVKTPHCPLAGATNYASNQLIPSTSHTRQSCNKTLAPYSYDSRKKCEEPMCPSRKVSEYPLKEQVSFRGQRGDIGKACDQLRYTGSKSTEPVIEELCGVRNIESSCSKDAGSYFGDQGSGIDRGHNFVRQCNSEIRKKYCLTDDDDDCDTIYLEQLKEHFQKARKKLDEAISLVTMSLSIATLERAVCIQPECTTQNSNLPSCLKKKKNAPSETNEHFEEPVKETFVKKNSFSTPSDSTNKEDIKQRPKMSINEKSSIRSSGNGRPSLDSKKTKDKSDTPQKPKVGYRNQQVGQK